MQLPAFWSISSKPSISLLCTQVSHPAGLRCFVGLCFNLSLLDPIFWMSFIFCSCQKADLQNMKETSNLSFHHFLHCFDFFICTLHLFGLFECFLCFYQKFDWFFYYQVNLRSDSCFQNLHLFHKKLVSFSGPYWDDLCRH